MKTPAKITVAIVGASGYSGEELVRILSRHPMVDRLTVTSRSLAGQAVVSVLPRLNGRVSPDLVFTVSEPEALAADKSVDLVFLALPHGVSAEYARPLVRAGKRVIDLSADFRLKDPAVYQSYYGSPHPAPELIPDCAYVIPELAPDGWQQKARLIASPGCYPTSVIVPLYPLLRQRVISPAGIIVNSMSGVSGAGKKAAEMYLYCERNESVKAYGLVKHRHLAEMEAELSASAAETVTLQFTPHLAPMSRGIATTIVARPTASGVEVIYDAWRKAYQGRPFVTLLPSDVQPDTAHVVGSNRICLSAAFDPRTGNLVITSAEDNLVKGASGQAVQIMNLWFGFEESTGLVL